VLVEPSILGILPISLLPTVMARRTGRCGRGVYRATMSFGIIGGLGEVVEGIDHAFIGADCVNRHLLPRSVTYNSHPIEFFDFCYSWYKCFSGSQSFTF